MPILNITHDDNIDIALGKSRREKNWKNRSILWSELINKLSETHRTAESHSEYQAAKKARQDEIKDIGGYVGGRLANGRRKANSVVTRQLITLDIDFATAEFWDDFTLLYGCAAALYSTHKHSKTTPRYRLLIPLDREVAPEEYQAIARKIAGTVDIEVFDPTTFQPERMMFWPSTSKDGEYVFEYQDGPWLKADVVLGGYHDWKDSSEWPVSERVNRIVHRSMVKQGDPLDKPGIIGAFCRTYTIHEVIEKYLSEVYEPCAIEDRYSYVEGSTAAGLVTYDDKFAFSHHGTDPVSGKLCNAFDLVRLHKFGLRDEDVREGTPGNKFPSYLAMCDLASEDADVRKEIVSEKLSNAKDDFAHIVVEDEETPEIDSDEWKSRLDVDRKGNVNSSIDNIYLILENDRYFKGKLAYDDFEKTEVAIKDLPWRKLTWSTRRLTDRDDANIRHYLEKVYEISNGTKTRDAMQILSEKTCFHPIRDYLKSLAWDGRNRLEEIFIKYMGVEDTPYTRTVTRKALVAAVARIFKPGVKFDNILTLVGKQGLKKSSLFAKLGGKWFSDSFSFHQLSKNETKACEQIQGVWIVEIAELAGMAKTDIETVKQFVSKTDDRFRVAYGHRTENFPRQCVFFATTNKFDFLRDVTGNRRYNPLFCNEEKVTGDVFAMGDYEIGQIWAEAVQLYNEGETLHLPEDLLADAIAMQKKHTEEHPWADIIRNYLDTLIPENWNDMNIYDKRAFLNGESDLLPEGAKVRERVCIAEIWAEALAGKTAIDERSAKVIRDVMSGVEGWEIHEDRVRYGAYGRQRKGYVRQSNGVPEGVLMVSQDGTVGTD